MDKQCKYCKRSLPQGGEFTLTILGQVVEECMICALVRQGVVDQYWGLSAEVLTEVQRIREQYFQQ